MFVICCTSTILVGAMLFRKEYLLVLELVFDRRVDQFVPTDFPHDLPDNAHIRHPFFLTLLLVVSEKVIIGLEYREVDDLEPTEWDRRANQVMGKPFYDSAARLLEPTVLLMNLRKHTF